MSAPLIPSSVEKRTALRRAELTPLQDAPSYNNTTDTEPVGARTALSAYPSRTPTLTSAPVIISAATAGKGRGVFATRAIPAGEVIEISPVLCIPAKEYYDGVDRSVLSGYVFTWKGIEGGMALALGLGTSRIRSSIWLTSCRVHVQPFCDAQRILHSVVLDIYDPVSHFP